MCPPFCSNMFVHEPTVDFYFYFKNNNKNKIFLPWFICSLLRRSTFFLDFFNFFFNKSVLCCLCCFILFPQSNNHCLTFDQLVFFYMPACHILVIILICLFLFLFDKECVYLLWWGTEFIASLSVMLFYSTQSDSYNIYVFLCMKNPFKSKWTPHSLAFQKEP